MTDAENASIRMRLLSHLNTPIVSPYHVRGAQFIFGHLGRIATASFIVLIITGGSLSALSTTALPGDVLYPIKIHVVEEIKSVSIQNKNEKLLWQKYRVEQRFAELDTLVKQGNLTDAKKQSATIAINNQLSTLKDEIVSTKENTANTTKAEQANTKQTLIEVASLKDTLEQHKDILATPENTKTTEEKSDIKETKNTTDTKTDKTIPENKSTVTKESKFFPLSETEVKINETVSAAEQAVTDISKNDEIKSETKIDEKVEPKTNQPLKSSTE